MSDSDSVFRNSLIENISDLCTLLPDLNVTNDSALEDMRKEIEKTLTTYIPDNIRQDKREREVAANEAKQVLRSIEDNMKNLETVEGLV